MSDIYIIEEDLFAPSQGHLIWFDVPPSSRINSVLPDTGYRAQCLILDKGNILFSGTALLKKRLQGKKISAVVLIPEKNLGKIPSESSIKVTVGSLVEND